MSDHVRTQSWSMYQNRYQNNWPEHMSEKMCEYTSEQISEQMSGTSEQSQSLCQINSRVSARKFAGIDPDSLSKGITQSKAILFRFATIYAVTQAHYFGIHLHLHMNDDVQCINIIHMHIVNLPFIRCLQI